MMWKVYAWFYVVIIIIGWIAIFSRIVDINMPLKILDSIISLFGIKKMA